MFRLLLLAAASIAVVLCVCAIAGMFIQQSFNKCDFEESRGMDFSCNRAK